MTSARQPEQEVWLKRAEAPALPQVPQNRHHQSLFIKGGGVERQLDRDAGSVN